MALPKGFKYKISLLADNKATASINKFKKDIGGVNNAVSGLKQALIAAFSVTEITQAANVMIGVKNRMDAFTGSAQETATAMNHMKRIAIESRSDFDAVAMLFTRLSLATEHLGATQRDVADATQMVANTFIIAGSHTQEANNSARQLAQGLASGALRGDELRSVMENNTILTKMLAEGLNMTVGELREFGHAGKLTAEVVMPILIDGIEETNELIKEMPMTLGQAGVALRNNFQFMIGDIQESTNGFSRLANIIKFGAENIDVIFIPAILAATAAIKALGLAVIRNPIGFLIAGLQASVMAAYVFRDEIAFIFKDVTEKRIPILIAKFQILGEKVKLAFHERLINPVKKAFSTFLNFIIGKVNDGVIRINELLDDVPKFIKDKLGVDKIPTIDLLPDPADATGDLKSNIETLVSFIEKTANTEIEKVNLKSITELLFPTDDAGFGSSKTGFGALSGLETFFRDAEKGYKDFISSIKTVQEEIQGVFKTTYNELTKLTTDFLKTGKASFKDFATAVVNELIRIAIQKLILDRMFATFGDFFKLGKKDGSGTSSSTGFDIMNNEGGGYTGMGVRAGGIDGRGGFPAILHPNETVIDHTKGQGMGTTVNFNISTVDAAGFDELLATRKNMIVSMVNQAYNSRGKMGIA
tara:strand:+ start:2512 stop:4449 length:1938 start_codon:yes stop_codon:yes gene_type:complete